MDEAFSTYLEFGEEKGKTSMLKWNLFGDKEQFFQVLDQKKVKVWKYDENTKNVSLLTELNSKHNLISGNWNLSGYSAVFIAQNSEGKDFQTLVL